MRKLLCYKQDFKSINAMFCLFAMLLKIQLAVVLFLKAMIPAYFCLTIANCTSVFRLAVSVFGVTYAFPFSPIGLQLFPIRACSFRIRRYLTPCFLTFRGVGVTLRERPLQGFPGDQLPLMYLTLCIPNTYCKHSPAGFQPPQRAGRCSSLWPRAWPMPWQ